MPVQRNRLWGILGLLIAVCSSGCSSRTPGALGTVRPAASDVLDLKDGPVDPLQGNEAKATVLIFVRTDCPISNRYAPEIQRLYQKYAAQGIRFWLVYPDPETTVGEIAMHLREYGLSLPVARDRRQALVKKAGVRVTPEAAVFSAGGREIYRGRIDDRFVDFGKERPAPTRNDLDEALRSILEGKPIVNATTAAVGCYVR